MAEPPLHGCIIAYVATTIPSLLSMIAREIRAEFGIFDCPRSVRDRFEVIGFKIPTARCFLLLFEPGVLYQEVVEISLGL
jgi:hypothetical protein